MELERSPGKKVRDDFIIVLWVLVTTDHQGCILPFNGCSSVDYIQIKGYIRALNATSFAWNCTVESSSLSNSCSVSMTGGNATVQDCTGTTHANTCTMTFGGGRGGITGPAAGDELKLLVRATATNANGTTTIAPKVRIIYDYVS